MPTWTNSPGKSAGRHSGGAWLASITATLLLAGTVMVATPGPAAAAGAPPAATGPSSATAGHGPGLHIPPWAPYPPDQLAISDCYAECASPAVVRSPRPWLEAQVVDPRGASLRVDFQVRTEPGALVATGSVTDIPSGDLARWRVPSDLTADQTYRFRVRAVKHPWVSGWSSELTFTVDTEAPERPTVSSIDYPPKDSGIWSGGPGQAGGFTFDPAGADDVIEFRYRWWDGQEQSVGVAPGATATVSLAPPGDLEQMLQVRSVDAAGNTSGWHAYAFLVRPPSAEQVHWRFNEGEGTEALPTTGGAAYTGRLHGGVSWVDSGINPSDPAASGTALSFDGQSGYVEAPPALVTDATAGWSVTAWVHPDGLSGWHTVLAQDGASRSLVQLQYQPTANHGDGGFCLVVRHSDTPGPGQTLVCAPTNQVPVGQWSHLAGVYDPVAGKVRLWVDGGPNNGEWPPGWGGEADAPQPVAAGGGFQFGRGIDETGAHGDYWHGRIDEVRVHQRPLNEFEVMFLFLQCRYGNCPV